MEYDCIIIGGGLSGLTCGIRCALDGLKCAIISSGMSALHFSSGSIDLFGYDAGGSVVRDPYRHIEGLISSGAGHPYAKCGMRVCRESMAFIREQARAGDLELSSNGDMNHFHVTAVGTLKPTFLSQQSVFSEKLRDRFFSGTRIVIMNFYGFRDFYPELALSGMRKHPLFKKYSVDTGTVELPIFRRPGMNPHEFRSIDIARIFESEKYLQKIAREIDRTAGKTDFVALPAFIGIRNFRTIHRRLEELTGAVIYEVPVLPPSILGMRIDTALKARFASLGGVFINGDRVTGGVVEGGRLREVFTENYGNSSPMGAKYFVLSTGSFFSGGIRSEFNAVSEPVLGLNVRSGKDRNEWYSPDFFSKESHPFLEYGVVTDDRLHPEGKDGNLVENLFCTGAILAGYNPVREGSGGGVALSTGYSAAEQICGALHDEGSGKNL